MKYKELLDKARTVYNNIAKNGPSCVQFEVRDFIASKIDQCSDRDEHLDILEWEEYKEKYAPMKKDTYERRKELAKETYERTLSEIEKEYNERGKFSPDYHKI